jgi:hypothetical protein
MLREGVWLYSLPTELANGLHRIQISGDLSAEIEFAVLCDTPTYTYTPLGSINCWAVVVLFVLATLWHLVVLYGMLWSGESVDPLKRAHKWLRGARARSSWALVLFAGPAVMGRGMRKLSLATKVVVMLAVGWGFSLPVGLFKIEDSVGGIWLVGFIADGKFVADFMCLVFPAVYLTLVVFALVVVLSLYDYEPSWRSSSISCSHSPQSQVESHCGSSLAQRLPIM